VRVVQAQARRGAIAGGIARDLSTAFADDEGEGGGEGEKVTAAIYDLRYTIYAAKGGEAAAIVSKFTLTE
jgi:hypothetical protein